MTLRFMRNKVMEVEARADGTLSVRWRVVDTFLEAGIRLTVRPPDLEIIEAEAEMPRHPYPERAVDTELIKDIVGVRVGAGLRKIVRGLMAAETGYNELSEGVLECCNAVILHFTVPQIRAGEGIPLEQKLEATRANLKSNPRLVGSCVAFQPGSPIMLGLDL